MSKAVAATVVFVQPPGWCVWNALLIWIYAFCCICSVPFSHSVVSDSLWPHGLQHARLSCPSPTLRAYSNSCPSNWWCHPTISSSVLPFSSCLQSFPALGSFPVSQFFTSGGQSIRASASASVLPMNIQDWFPLGLTGLISLQSKLFLLKVVIFLLYLIDPLKLFKVISVTV